MTMNLKAHFLPCPFCGSSDFYSVRHAGDYQFRCGNYTECRTVVPSILAPSLIEVAYAWNQRNGEDPEPALPPPPEEPAFALVCNDMRSSRIEYTHVAALFSTEEKARAYIEAATLPDRITCKKGYHHSYYEDSCLYWYNPGSLRPVIDPKTGHDTNDLDDLRIPRDPDASSFLPSGV